MAESSVRLERAGGFTILKNEMLRDPRLSNKTVGMLARMTSLPPNWNYSISGLAKFFNTGRGAVSTALAELEAAGYLERRQEHAQRGRFGGMVYVIRETSSMPLDREAIPEEPDPEPPGDDAPPLPGFPSTVDPSAVNPSPDEPSTENRAERNTVSTQERLSNPPIVPPRGRRRREPKTEPEWKPERFARFWAFYRDNVRGEAKQAAIRAWDKLKPDDGLLDTIGRALLVQIASEGWRAGIGKPYASTYLNNARWTDVAGPDGRVVRPDKPPPEGVWREDPEVI